jgi:hypothetical protein
MKIRERGIERQQIHSGNSHTYRELWQKVKIPVISAQ